MSFILDALKKSETDRQRQSGPSLFEVKVAAPRRRLPIWAVAIAVLLGINLIVVSWMLLRRPSPQQSAATSSAAAAPAGHTLLPSVRQASRRQAPPLRVPRPVPHSGHQALRLRHHHRSRANRHRRLPRHRQRRAQGPREQGRRPRALRPQRIKAPTRQPPVTPATTRQPSSRPAHGAPAPPRAPRPGACRSTSRSSTVRACRLFISTCMYSRIAHAIASS